MGDQVTVLCGACGRTIELLGREPAVALTRHRRLRCPGQRGLPLRTVPCGSAHPTLPTTCDHAAGHLGPHEAEATVRVAWSDPPRYVRDEDGAWRAVAP